MPFEVGDTAGLVAPLVQDVPYEPDFIDETLPAAFRQENMIGSAVQMMRKAYQPTSDEVDPNYDALNVMRPEDEDYVNEIARFTNATQLQALENRIDAERKDRALLGQAMEAGPGGLVATALAGVSDPTILVPGSVGFKTARMGGAMIGRSAMAVGLAGGVGVGIQEGVLQTTQLERTTSESLINVAAATILSGIVGGAIGGVKHVKASRALAYEADDAVARITNDITPEGVPTPGGSAGAARVRDLTDAEYNMLRVKIDAMVAKGKLSPDDADVELAAQVTSELLKRDGMKTNWAVDAALVALGGLSPELRLLNSPSSVARQLFPELAEPTMRLARNQINEATPLSAESIVKDWQGNRYRSLKFQDDQYVQYAKGRAKQFGDIAVMEAKRLVGVTTGKMTPGEFNEAVARAMIRGDDASSIAGVPPEAVDFINKTAANWRKEVIDPLTQTAIKMGELPEDVSVDTAASYFMRMYDIDKLTKSKAHRDGFLGKTFDYLSQRQGQAEGRTQSFDAEAKVAREEIAAIKQQIAAIEDGVRKGTALGTKEETKAATDAALRELEDRLTLDASKLLGDATPVQAKAKKAAVATFFKTLRKELAEQTHEQVGIAVEKEASKALNELLDTAGARADDELMPIIRDELTQVGVDTASEAAAKGLPKALEAAMGEAALKAEKAMAASIKSQEAKIAKMLTDPKEASAAARSAITRKIARVAADEAAKAARAATKEIRKDLAEKAKVFAKRRKLHNRDTREVTMSPDELKSVAQEILDRIVATKAGRMPYDMATETLSSGGARSGVGSSRPLHKRAFGIQDVEIEDYLVMDAEHVMDVYVRSMSSDLALREKGFTGAEWESKVKAIEDEYAKLKNVAKTDKDLAALEKNRQQDVKDLMTLRERLLNVHGLPDDPASWGARVGRGVLQYNYITKLGGMTASAFADAARAVMVHGYIRTIGTGVVPMLTDFKNFGKMTQELRAMGIATDMIDNSRMNSISDTLNDDFARGNRLERSLGGMSNTFGMVTLMAPWNTAWKQFAGVVGIHRLTKAMREDVAGTISAKEREWLRGSMIGEDHSRIIIAQLDEFGKPDGSFIFPQVDTWSDAASARLFRQALRRQVDEIIVTPGIGDRPTWTSGSMTGKLISQFKSFALSATSRVLMSGLQQADMAALNGVILSVTLGSMSSAFKMWDAGRGDELKDWTASKWVTEGVDRSGVTGVFSDVNNVAEKLTRGTIGMSAFNGGKTASRYASRNWVGAIAGPSLGTATQVGVSVGNLFAAGLGGEPWTADDTSTFMRTVPYNNLMGARQLFKSAEEGINNALGVR